MNKKLNLSALSDQNVTNIIANGADRIGISSGVKILLGEKSASDNLFQSE